MGLAQVLFGAKPPFGTPPFAPQHPQTGGADKVPMPGQQQRGISGFLERALNPTNALGQFGQMLVASQDNGLGQAMGGMMQMGQQRRDEMRKQQMAMQPKLENLGNGDWGFVDPQTGKVTVTHDSPDKATGYGADLVQEGLTAGSPEYIKRLNRYNTSREDRPIAVPGFDAQGQQTLTFIPRSQMSGGLGGPQPSPAPVKAPPQAAIERLMANPALAPAFDEKYGQGSSSRCMGGAGSQGPATFSQRAVDAVTAQESGGRVGVEGPQTRWGRAQGLMQVLPETAKEMASKLGLPYRPDLMTGKTPEAARYQQTIGTAYLQEGFAKTGNERDAFRYYHGGPNRSMWGPKTNAYADQVLSRLGRSR